MLFCCMLDSISFYVDDEDLLTAVGAKQENVKERDQAVADKAGDAASRTKRILLHL